jgi:hypothetical protein
MSALRSIAAAVAICVVSATFATAQSLTDLSAAEARRRAALAKDKPATATDSNGATPLGRVYTDKDLPPAVAAAPEMTPAEAADINRSLFDRVYAAGVAMTASGYAAQRTPLALQAMLTFKTEVQIASDKAQTKAEKSLALKYGTAQWMYELTLDPLVVPTASKWKAAFEKATAALDEADAIYLNKKR